MFLLLSLLETRTRTVVRQIPEEVMSSYSTEAVSEEYTVLQPSLLNSDTIKKITPKTSADEPGVTVLFTDNNRTSFSESFNDIMKQIHANTSVTNYVTNVLETENVEDTESAPDKPKARGKIAKDSIELQPQ